MTADVAPPMEEKPDVRVTKSFDLLNVIVEKVSGTVKWFSTNRRYGFIQRDDNKEDVFVHRTAITASKQRFPTLKSGETVEFSVVETTSGITAASVTGPGGKAVKGSRRFMRRVPYVDKENNAQYEEGVRNTQINETNGSGDVEGNRRRNFRGPRRGTGRRPNRAGYNGMGDDTNGGYVEERHNGGEGGFSPTGGALRPRPRRERGRGGYEYSGSRPIHHLDEGEDRNGIDRQQRQPHRPRRPYGRGRRVFNTTKHTKPNSEANENIDTDNKIAQATKLPIDKELENLKINVDDEKKSSADNSENVVAEVTEVNTNSADDEVVIVHTTKVESACTDEFNN